MWLLSMLRYDNKVGLNMCELVSESLCNEHFHGDLLNVGADFIQMLT